MTQLDKTKARAIGVSNFTKEHIEAIISASGVTPANLQIERHPLLPQLDLIQYCEKRGITVVAYSPLGNNTIGVPLLTEHEKVKAIAEKHKITPGQVLIAWGTSLPNVAAIPKSVNADRIKSNLELKTLDKVDIDVLNSLGETEGRRYNVPTLYGTRWSINIWNDPQETNTEHRVIV